MQSRFEKYRVKDGLTRLGEAFFNPVFADLDLRLVALEAVRTAWQEAIAALSEHGLRRINDVLGPALTQATDATAEIDSLLTEALADIAQITAIVASTEADVQTALDAWLAARQTDIGAWQALREGDIDAWKAARLAELAIWRDGQDAEIGGIDAHLLTVDAGIASLDSRLDTAEVTLADAAGTRLPALEGDTIIRLTWDARATLRATTPTTNHRLALVENLGLYMYVSGSTEADDDETCFATATASGCWLIQAVHWDLVDAWLGDETAANKPLIGAASHTFLSLAALAQASFTTLIPGARPGDTVVVTPPSVLHAALTVQALVSAENTITITLGNPSASTVSSALGSGLWSLAVVRAN